MTREQLLKAVAEAVLQCPQLKATQTVGQRANAAKQICARLDRRLPLTAKDRIVYRDDPEPKPVRR